MNRRNLIKYFGLLGLQFSLPTISREAKASNNGNGYYLLSIEAKGGWDIAGFCDPQYQSASAAYLKTLDEYHKMDGSVFKLSSGLEFCKRPDTSTDYSDTLESITSRMQLFNGIEMKTNSHSKGTRYAATGRPDGNIPTLASIYAEVAGQHCALPHISQGAFLSGYENPLLVTHLLDPFQTKNLLNSSGLKGVKASEVHKNFTISTSGKQRKALQQYLQSFPSQPIDLFKEQVNQLQTTTIDSGQNLFALRDKARVEIAIAAFASNTSLSADLRIDNEPAQSFDTHTGANPIKLQTIMLQRLVSVLEEALTLAEKAGISDKLVILVHSDFGRTLMRLDNNFGTGTDHATCNSMMIIKPSGSSIDSNKRTFGSSSINQIEYNVDGIKKSYYTLSANKIDLQTGKPSTTGRYLTPEHCHNELRRYLGIYNEITNNFDQYSLSPTGGEISSFL